MDDKPLLIHRTYKGPDSENNYTRVDNRLIDDTRLSPLARLAMVYVLSKPDTWIVQNYDLERYLGAGIHKTRKIIGELKKLGYFERKQRRDKDNRKWYTTKTEVFEVPELRNNVVSLSSDDKDTPLIVLPKIYSLVTTESETTKLITNEGRVSEQINDDFFQKNVVPSLKLQFRQIQWERAVFTKTAEDITIALVSQQEIEVLNPRKPKIEKIVSDNLGQSVKVEFVTSP